MASEDPTAPFAHIPWIAKLVGKPNMVWKVPGSRELKDSTEDSLFAEILKTPRTIRNCVAFYQKPARDTDQIAEMMVALTIGDGMNGHPEIIHGGITATLCDEAMGMYQAFNKARARLAEANSGQLEGGSPLPDLSSFTAELKITYLKPVLTPGALVVTATRVKKEGRKEWLRTEVKQCQGSGEGQVVVCAVGEALFIQTRRKANL